MKKMLFLALTLAALLLLPSCGQRQGAENKEYAMGERAVTAFLEYGVNDAFSCQNYHGVRARDGHQVVVVSLSIWNTEDYTLPMSRYDFRLQWGDGAEDYAYPLAWYYQEQLPNQYDIAQDGEVQGELVFQVPEDERDLALGFLEVFEDESQGDAHFIYFTV